MTSGYLLIAILIIFMVIPLCIIIACIYNGIQHPPYINDDGDDNNNYNPI